MVDEIRNADNSQREMLALQNELTGALIGLARAAAGNEDLITEETNCLILQGLAATLPGGVPGNVALGRQEVCDFLVALTAKVHAEKDRLAPNCRYCMNSCGKNDDYDLRIMSENGEEIHALKALILLQLQAMAACAYPAALHGHTDPEVMQYFYKALFTVGMDWEEEGFRSVVLEAAGINLKCMKLFEQGCR